MKQELSKLNFVLKNMGFRVAYGNQYFGEYNTSDAHDDYTQFDLKSRSEGDASFIRWPKAAIEKDGRFVELTRIIDYDRITRNQVFEFKIETAWKTYLDARNDQMVGKVYYKINTAEKIKIDELNNIYIRKKSTRKTRECIEEKQKFLETSSFDTRPEMISFEEFDTGIKNFDDFFNIRFGSQRVREALKGIHTIGITQSLEKWERMIYDIIIEDVVIIQINPAKIWGYPFFYLASFSKLIPQLLDDLIVFVQKLEKCLITYTPLYDNRDKVYKCVTLKASIKCAKCNANIPVNGLVSSIICHQCKTENRISNGQWEKILFTPFLNYEEGKGKMHVDVREDWEFGHFEWNAENPGCCHCGTPFHESQIKNHSFNRTTSFECPNCKGINTASPPPDWALELSPFMVLIYNTEQENSISGKLKPWSVKYWFLDKEKL